MSNEQLEGGQEAYRARIRQIINDQRELFDALD